MSTSATDNKALNRNAIKNFILRVDLIKNEDLNIENIAEKMAAHFDRAEKRAVNSLTIKVANSNAGVTQNAPVYDYVLIKDATSISMTFSETENSFYIQSNQYNSNEVYKDLIKTINNEIAEICPETEANRIGLRYINEFQCNSISSIGRIYGKRLSSIVKAMMKDDDNQKRVICVEEYINDENEIRLQYGIPNKFYPAVMKTYDLLLDIDSFSKSVFQLSDFEATISDLNHAAYGKFIKEMNPKYIETLR